MFYGKIQKRLYILFYLLTLVFQHSQAKQISVRPIPLINQLPSYSVQRIYQDKEGFMWIGTLDGLCRYDAYRMLVFRSNRNNPNLLTNNEITSFAEDQNGHLLIGTKKGLNILDKKTYQIKPFEDSKILNKDIKCITVDKDGTIWIGTNTHVYRYNADLTLNKIYESLVSTSVNGIYQDRDGSIWATLWNSGLYKYNPNTDAFVKYPQIGSADNPFKIFQDNKKQYWICTWGDGVYLFDPQKEGADMYTHQNIELNGKPLSEDRFFSITQDDEYGYIWIMSLSGLYAKQYMPDGQLKDVDISYLFKASNNIFSEIVKDRVGNLWIATFSEGLLTINFDRPAIQNYAMASIKEQTGIMPNITAIYKDRQGDIWINQNRWGLGVFNPNTNTVRFYKEYPQLKKLASLNIVSCISGFRSIPNEIWVGPENESAIYCMNKDKDNITVSKRIDLETIVSNAGKPRFFFEDRNNNIWIATTTGLLVKPFSKDHIEAISFSLGIISGIAEDSRGTIWICSKDLGVFEIPVSGNLETMKSQIKNINKAGNALLSTRIASICTDKNDKVWIGTKNGSIVKYDPVNQTLEDVSDSFKMTGEGILNLISDDFGHIWITTNKYITEYNPANGASRNYSNVDGVIVNSFLINSYFKDSNETILLGGNRGISAFTPSEKLSEQAKQAKAFITDIKINNQSVFQSNNNNRFEVTSQTLTFEPGDKNIEIDFSSLDYTFPSKIRYAYKMEGVDDDWVYTENDRQFAIYNQLSKGMHIFYIKATDENRLWSSEVASIKIYKRPAFYETWWAYTIYSILLLAAIYMTYRIVRNRIRLRNELKIAQIEKDKSEELTQTKLRYFTNISHDFLTPLTIISCLIDDAEITNKGRISQFEPMRSSLNRLRRLLQQVLDFRKIESGNMKLQISNGEIVEFIRELCYTHFLPLMRKKNIEFSFDAQPNQIQGYFDADKIDKIIFNLLSNAFKYTPHSGNVKVELRQYLNKQIPFLQIVVSDSGVGIVKEDLSNIFTRFYTNKMSKASDTNGIGLSLTKDLVDLHHGAIRVESEANVGTTFTIDIPIGKSSYNDSEIGEGQVIMCEKNVDSLLIDQSATENTHIDNGRSTQQITILLVEDNEELMILISNILSKHYHVLTASNGIEALLCINSNDVGIVISDIMMPEMDGLELCNRLKKDLRTSHIPIILLTAKSSTEDRIECYNAGADGYISKPFDLKVLEARIRNFLANKQDKQEKFKTDLEINISTLEYPSLDEQFLNNAIKIIEDHLSDPELDINTFAEHLSLSKSSLYRKIKTMTNLSPIEFIRNIRLKHACQMLKDKSISISEVAYSVGFSDPKYFASCFKQEFNITPSDFQRNTED